MDIDLVLKRLELIKEGKGIGTISDIEASIILNEIERLNNIINELEKSIDNKLKEFENNKDYFIDETTMKDLLDFLQELKGDGSNELYNRNNK